MRITSVRSDGSAIVRGKAAFPMKKKKKKGAIQLPTLEELRNSLFEIVSLTKLNVTGNICVSFFRISCSVKKNRRLFCLATVIYF